MPEVVRREPLRQLRLGARPGNHVLRAIVGEACTVRLAEEVGALEVTVHLQGLHGVIGQRHFAGAATPAVVTAAEKAARAEDTAIFNGFQAGGIKGIIPSSPHPAIAIPDDYADYPSVVGRAVETLRRAGINGPYALALGPDCYAGLAQAAEDGYPIRERVEHFLDGPMVLAPTIGGAVLLSHRGGDHQLSVGQDMSVGYAGHGKDEVHLYLTESFAFRVLDRAAAVYLKPKRQKK